MSQHDFNIANQGFPAFRSDLNNALAALATLSSGGTAPSSTYAGQLWLDTAADPSVLKVRNADDDAWISVLELNQTSDTLTKVYGLVIGTDVQAYDADTAKTDTAQTYTASQRGTVTTDNDGSFDMSATNNFKCTPTGNFTLTFTNITAGQSGNVWLDNSGGYTVSAHSAVYINADTLAALSTAGVYWLSYYSPDGTNVAVAATGAIV